MITSKRTPWYLRLVWLCLHGIQFPTDPMMDQFLSSVISMVAPTRCHGPIGGNPVWGDCSTDLTSEFTVFNLVIRLSKVKQSAFFQVSHRRVGFGWTIVPLCLGNHLLFLTSPPLTAVQNLHFSPYARETDRCHSISYNKAIRTCFRYGSSSFLVFSVRSTSCAPN